MYVLRILCERTISYDNILFVNESDLRSNVHYLGSSENKAWKHMTSGNLEAKPIVIHDTV